MKVFVTGASGFIGEALTSRLLASEGLAVGGIDLVPAAKPRTAAFDFIQADLASLRPGQRNQLREKIEQADVVIHLAAESYVHDSYDAPERYVQNNIAATFQLLEIIRVSSPVRLIHVSTCEVYGNTGLTAATELSMVRPLSPYAATKLSGEALSSAYASSYQIPTTIVRPFNLYGPGQQSNRLIPRTIARVRDGQALHVSGDGRQVRDWTYVADAVELFIRIAHTISAEPTLEVVNLSSGRGTSVNEILRMIANAAGRKPALRWSDEHAGSLRTSVGANHKATKKYGWSPRVCLEEGIERTVRLSRGRDA